MTDECLCVTKWCRCALQLIDINAIVWWIGCGLPHHEWQGPAPMWRASLLQIAPSTGYCFRWFRSSPVGAMVGGGRCVGGVISLTLRQELFHTLPATAHAPTPGIAAFPQAGRLTIGTRLVVAVPSTKSFFGRSVPTAKTRHCLLRSHSTMAASRPLPVSDNGDSLGFLFPGQGSQVRSQPQIN